MRLVDADKILKHKQTYELPDPNGGDYHLDAINAYYVINAPTVETAVVPPVDVGDKVWYINGGYYNSARLEPREIEVTEINKKKSGKTIDWAFIANRTRYKFSSIGKTVFLTKEDCLAAINNKKAKNYKQHIV